ncbi:unnamed protein product [Prunus armeniaca]
MGGYEDLHLGHGGAADDDIVGCGAVDNEEGSGDCPPLGCRSNRDWEMNAFDGLDHLTREFHQGCNASVEQVRWDLELVEGFSKHHTDRDTPHIKVRNVSTDNDWVIVGENNTALLLLAEGGADIMLDGVVAGHSQGGTTIDS